MNHRPNVLRSILLCGLLVLGGLRVSHATNFEDNEILVVTSVTTPYRPSMLMTAAFTPHSSAQDAADCGGHWDCFSPAASGASRWLFETLLCPIRSARVPIFQLPARERSVSSFPEVCRRFALRRYLNSSNAV